MCARVRPGCTAGGLAAAREDWGDACTKQGVRTYRHTVAVHALGSHWYAPVARSNGGPGWLLVATVLLLVFSLVGALPHVAGRAAGTAGVPGVPAGTLVVAPSSLGPACSLLFPF